MNVKSGAFSEKLMPIPEPRWILALANDHEEAARRYARAVSLGEAIANAEDRKGFFEQLHEGPWFGLDRRR